MRGSFKIAEIAGISINVHMTFLLLALFLVFVSPSFLLTILIVFFLVTVHELSHSLVAKKFGIDVKEITLLPIGGVASMTKMPEKPYQEFFISLAGPLINIVIAIVFYFPLRYFWGGEFLFSSYKLLAYQPANLLHFFTQIYWINIILALFNLLPAFPMDGGRIVRAVLAQSIGMRRATKIAVSLGHFFAVLFGIYGFTRGHLLLIIIAIFIYMAASSEGLQVDLRATLKKFRVKDILPTEFLTVQSDATFSKVLELIFHSRQEDFPVMDESGRMAGFITRNDVINGIHTEGVSGRVSMAMRQDMPRVAEHDTLEKAQNIMQSNELKALPVMRDGNVVGVITTEDISRVYNMMSRK